MHELDFDRLEPIGLSPVMARAVALVREEIAGAPLRVTEVHRETLRVHDGRTEFTARALPRLQRSLIDAGEALAVGDWLLAECDRHGDWWAHLRITPQTQLARRDMHGQPQVFASNVDTALLVMGLDADFSPRRLERYLALVQGSGVEPVIVLSKADLCGATLDERIDALRIRLPAGLNTIAVNALDGSAATPLAPWLGAGQTLVMLGSSGAGKSTLTNTPARRGGAGYRRRSPGRLPRTAYDDGAFAALAAWRRLCDRHARRAHAAAGDRRGRRRLRRRHDARACLPLSRLPTPGRAGVRGARSRAARSPGQLSQARA